MNSNQGIEKSTEKAKDFNGEGGRSYPDIQGSIEIKEKNRATCDYAKAFCLLACGASSVCPDHAGCYDYSCCRCCYFWL